MSTRIVKTIEFTTKNGGVLALTVTSNEAHALTFEVFDADRASFVAGSLDEQELADLQSFIEERAIELEQDGV